MAGAASYMRWWRHGDPVEVAQIFGDDEARFLSYVDLNVPGCAEWRGDLNWMGYGKFSVKGQFVSAHRWAFEHWIGPAHGLLVCHTCDNPPCVKPGHLFIDTSKGNTADMISKGRASWQRPRASG